MKYLTFFLLFTSVLVADGWHSIDTIIIVRDKHHVRFEPDLDKQIESVIDMLYNYEIGDIITLKIFPRVLHFYIQDSISTLWISEDMASEVERYDLAEFVRIIENRIKCLYFTSYIYQRDECIFRIVEPKGR